VGLWKGNGMNVVRIIPTSAIRFASYEKYKMVLENYILDKDMLRVTSGGLAGTTAVLLTYPLDFIRIRFTMQNFASGIRYTNILGASKLILKEEGFMSFYKGFFASCLGIAPYIAINFSTYEKLKDYFSHSPGLYLGHQH